MKKATKQEGSYMSQTQAARHLGMAQSELSRAAKLHSLYAPAVRGLPGAGTVGTRKIGTRFTRYHIEQVQTIERVLLGAVDLETGWLEWQIKRKQIIEKGAL